MGASPLVRLAALAASTTRAFAFALRAAAFGFLLTQAALEEVKVACWDRNYKHIREVAERSTPLCIHVYYIYAWAWRSTPLWCGVGWVVEYICIYIAIVWGGLWKIAAQEPSSDFGWKKGSFLW